MRGGGEGEDKREEKREGGHLIVIVYEKGLLRRMRTVVIVPSGIAYPRIPGTVPGILGTITSLIR